MSRIRHLLSWIRSLMSKECMHPEDQKSLIILQANVTVETLIKKCGRCGHKSEPFIET